MIHPIIGISFNDETNQIVINTDSTDAIALLEALVKAQQTILNSIRVPTPSEIIGGEEPKIII